MSEATAAVRHRLLRDHRDALEATRHCARSVAETWNAGSTDERSAVVEPFRRALDRRGVLAHSPAMLVDAAAAMDAPLPARPVAAPPYVVVTSTGLLLRATLPGGRLVVRAKVFAVDRSDRGPRYRRLEGSIEDILEVRFVRSSTGRRS